MKVHQLPDYSAERYYLISEIEQKAHFLLLDETDDASKPTASHPLIFYYTRWTPQQEDNKDIISKVQALQRQVPLSASSSTSFGLPAVVVVIEAYITNQEAWDKDLENNVSDLLKTAQSNFGSQNVIVGITDCIGGTPALEKCHDLIESLLPGYENMTIVADFVANQRMDMLGLDPNTEPDAQSQVFQLLCLPADDVFDALEDDARDKVHLFLANNAQLGASNNVNTSQIIMSLLLVSLFAVFLAHLAQQVNLM